ncbi:MAG: hypothetical protein A2X94_02550 [Bdellovibrionales bacterium GWB1_55_8]|nr:MAG: hypothetical protein A2X94_02550 [Bdellovibrionales bacterium GWB1_55_8]
MSKLQVRRLSHDAILPTRAHPDDAGLDLYLLEPITIAPGEGVTAATGIAAAIPHGFVGMIADRSSMAKKGLKTAGGIIDSGYRGEIRIVLWNLSRETHSVAKGDRIAQLLVIPVALSAVEEVTSLEDTHRGSGGFGSTGN